MSRVKCDHCQLEFDKGVMIEDEIDGEKKYFCCKGCQGVYHLLKNEGLDSFYDKLGKTELEPVSQKDIDLQKFDLEGFKKKYIKQTKDGFNEISLIIEGIHCAACVWLNEKVLHNQDGIIEATINYTNNKAKVIWDPKTIKLSQIIEAIKNIGYNAYPYDASLQETRAIEQRRDYYARILVAVFATMNIMWIAIAQYLGYFTGMRKDVKNILNIAEFVLATPTLFFSGWVFFKGAYYGLKNKFINMDLLVSFGAMLAFLYSIWAMITKEGEVYFDSVTMIITFVLVGKYLEVLSKKEAVDTLDSLLGTTPTEVSVIKNNQKALVSVENVVAGDVIELKPGEIVVIDGEIISGNGSFDESSLTGESKPVFKKEGDKILSGSVNIQSIIRYKTTKDFSTSLLSNITNLLEDSITKKPYIEKLANKISGIFSLSILTIAIVTFISWFFYTAEFEKALIVSISVIVIACPCALGLATPMATLLGISIAAKKGILFKEAAMIETMAKSDTLLLDKTGTITEGKPSVVRVKIFEEFNKNLLYSLVLTSKHPISQGILNYLKENEKNLQDLNLLDVKNIEAKGIKAIYKNKILLGGSLDILEQNNISFSYKSENSIFVFAIDKKVKAIFELKDKLKKGTTEAISSIKKLGIKTIMLTGDNKAVAQKIANEAGIDSYQSNLLPQDKLKFVEDMQKKGHIVVMAGDGINDSLALSRSNIAIAMGNGADIAISVSDVVLMDDNPKNLFLAYKISKRAFRGVKENLFLSLVYNIIAIPLAVIGFVNPLIAALSMSLSSLIVVGNSFRIKRGVEPTA